MTSKPAIIFLGNGPLADAARARLEESFTIIFHAHTKADLDRVCALKEKNPELPAVLASFGVILKPEVLDLFEPTGILNLHPSLLPQYRGASPIETALLNGDREFGVSIMKISAAMDAGPIYWQTSVDLGDHPTKAEVYQKLATLGSDWLTDHLFNLPEPRPQDDAAATFTRQFQKSDAPLDAQHKTAAQLEREVRAFAGFPKSKYQFGDFTCTILAAHVGTPQPSDLSIACADDTYLIIDELQPESRKAMTAQAFKNGYLH